MILNNFLYLQGQMVSGKVIFLKPWILSIGADEALKKLSQLDKEPILEQGIYYEESKVPRQKISTDVLIFLVPLPRALS